MLHGNNKINLKSALTVSVEANCSLVVIVNFLLSMEYAMYHGATDQHIFFIFIFRVDDTIST